MNLGVLGYNTHTGLGNMTRDLIRHLGAVRHLVPHHAMDCGQDWAPETIRATLWSPPGPLVDQFLKGLDAVVTVETDYDTQLAERAKDLGVRSIFVPMWEWQGEPFLYHGFDLYVCTSKIGWTKCPMPNKVYLPWPVDTAAFPYFPRRGPARTFLHNAGHGGMHGRKGTTEAVLGFLAADLPEGCMLRVRSQVPLAQFEQPVQDALRGSSRIAFLEGEVPLAELYQFGDAYLYTARLDGQSMVAFEAAASGLPTFVTRAAPMHEADLPPWAWIDRERGPVREIKGQQVQTYRCRIDAVAQACQYAATHDLTLEMARVRDILEAGYSWNALEARWLACLSR